MERNRHFPLASRIVTRSGVRKDQNRLRATWLAAITIFGLGGVGAGSAGLLISFLVAEGVIPADSSVRWIVPMLIVASLTLLMGTAHALDRLNQIGK